MFSVVVALVSFYYYYYFFFSRTVLLFSEVVWLAVSGWKVNVCSGISGRQTIAALSCIRPSLHLTRSFRFESIVASHGKWPLAISDWQLSSANRRSRTCTALSTVNKVWTKHAVVVLSKTTVKRFGVVHIEPRVELKCCYLLRWSKGVELSVRVPRREGQCLAMLPLGEKY